MSTPHIYGVALEFDSPAAIVEAARALHQLGFRQYEAYTPYPVKELDEVIPGDDPVPLMVLTAGVVGAVTALLMEYFVAAYEFPINVGGRPLNSWPAFIPIAFELTVLFASIAAFIGTLWLAGLPLLHHPVFNLADFRLAACNRFFLVVEASDTVFDFEDSKKALHALGAISVQEVEGDE